jgi:hypothetical protein
MVTKIDKSKSTNVKVKQKQNVNVRVNIDQRNTKKKPRKKRSNIPSAKREGVSSFSSGFTPVYIQSGNPYPNYPQAPDIQPIRKNPVSQEVHTLVNPPVTSTTDLIQQVQSRSITPIPLSFGEEKTPLLSESGMQGRGIMRYEPSTGNSKFPSNPMNSAILKRREEMIEIGENRNMGNEDINRIVKKIPRNRRTKEEIEEAKFKKIQKQIDKDISKNERDLMKQEDTRRKEQLKKERNERNRMGRNDINVVGL